MLKVHRRDDQSNPLTGVFLTRSEERPNPIGLHRVTVHEVTPYGVLVGPIEAIDGPPVIDIKAVKVIFSGRIFIQSGYQEFDNAAFHRRLHCRSFR